jgi:two-component system chemotaxis response regulator CheY
MPIDKSMNVLIVDDYKTMLRIIRNLLKQIEFNNVDEATDGAEALAKLRSGNFGLVISDWNMVPMTGLQLLQEVRADARLKSTPFIMVTAESKAENVVAAKQAGVSNYIVKPFNAETLREKIEKVLGHDRLRPADWATRGDPRTSSGFAARDSGGSRARRALHDEWRSVGPGNVGAVRSGGAWSHHRLRQSRDRRAAGGRHHRQSHPIRHRRA